MEEKKDFWDKLKISAFVAIPVLVAFFGSLTNTAIKDKDVGARMVEIAVGILKEDPKKENKETPSLRQWAIDIIKEYSEVELSAEVEKELRKTSLPKEIILGTWKLGTATATETASRTATITTEDTILVFYGVAIHSQPSGAKIYVNGYDTGETTNKVIPMSPGEHEIKLKLNNEERIVRIKPSVTSKVNINFDR
jgi:hypothetical protein